MLEFYKRLILRLPIAFWEAVEPGTRVVTIVGLAIALLVAANQPLGSAMEVVWQGIPSPWSDLPIGIILFYLVLRENYNQWRLLKEKVDKYESPVIDLTFDPNDPSCLQHDIVRHPVSGRPVDMTLFRVRVGNLSGRPLIGVTVQLLSCDPLRTTFYPIPMKVMHDAVPPHARSINGFRIDAFPGKTYVDVAYTPTPNDDGQIALAYAVPTAPNLIPDGRYVLTLAASAAEGPSTTQQFALSTMERERPNSQS